MNRKKEILKLKDELIKARVFTGIALREYPSWATTEEAISLEGLLDRIKYLEGKVKFFTAWNTEFNIIHLLLKHLNLEVSTIPSTPETQVLKPKEEETS